MQVDYASAALFLNISMHVSGSSESPVAWWQYPELKMKAGLDPHTQASPLICCHAVESLPTVSCISSSEHRKAVL